MSTTEQQQFYLNDCTGDRGWGDLTWNIVEPGKLIRTDTQLGSYSLELQPDGKTYRLTFNSGSQEIRTCPTKFQATNRAVWEADDHHRRLLAQQQQPSRLEAPKW